MLDTTNRPHLEEWLVELETTTLPQANGWLSALLDRGGETLVGYCCLGIGERCRNPHSPTVIEHGTTSLPPPSFFDWLGIDRQRVDNNGESSDVVLDWSLTLYPWREGEPEAEAEAWGVEIDEVYWVTATMLNDIGHLSFAQIAQCIRYFGIRGVGHG